MRAARRRQHARARCAAHDARRLPAAGSLCHRVVAHAASGRLGRSRAAGTFRRSFLHCRGDVFRLAGRLAAKRAHHRALCTLATHADLRAVSGLEWDLPGLQRSQGIAVAGRTERLSRSRSALARLVLSSVVHAICLARDTVGLLPGSAACRSGKSWPRDGRCCRWPLSPAWASPCCRPIARRRPSVSGNWLSMPCPRPVGESFWRSPINRVAAAGSAAAAWDRLPAGGRGVDAFTLHGFGQELGRGESVRDCPAGLHAGRLDVADAGADCPIGLAGLRHLFVALAFHQNAGVGAGEALNAVVSGDSDGTFRFGRWRQHPARLVAQSLAFANPLGML